MLELDYVVSNVWAATTDKAEPMLRTVVTLTLNFFKSSPSASEVNRIKA